MQWDRLAVANLRFRDENTHIARKHGSSAGRPIWAVAAVALGLILAATVVNAQSDPGDAVRLPYTASMNQPAPSPIHETSWTIRRVTDKGRSLALANDAVVLFDWGEGVGESTASIFDGCAVSNRNFTWSERSLKIAPATYSAIVPESGAPCVSAQSTWLAALTGTFRNPKASTFADGSTLVLTRSRIRVELVRRADSSLVGTAWRTTDTIVRNEQRRQGTLSFGHTRYMATDTCNSIEGHFLHVGDRLLPVGRWRTTAAACPSPPPALGWRWESAIVTRAGETLTITNGARTHTYRQVQALPWDAPSLPPSIPPFSAAAVFGSWRIESVGNRNGPGATGTIDFRKDGTLVGETPCESFAASWSPEATSMATTVRDLKRTPKTCDESLKPDASALGDLLATGRLAVGRGDIRLTLWRSGQTDLSTGINFIKA